MSNQNSLKRLREDNSLDSYHLCKNVRLHRVDNISFLPINELWHAHIIPHLSTSDIKNIRLVSFAFYEMIRQSMYWYQWVQYNNLSEYELTLKEFNWNVYPYGCFFTDKNCDLQYVTNFPTTLFITQLDMSRCPESFAKLTLPYIPKSLQKIYLPSLEKYDHTILLLMRIIPNISIVSFSDQYDLFYYVCMKGDLTVVQILLNSCKNKQSMINTKWTR